jgi:transcriptional regulator with PAS, ATPase and Fis domain
LGKTVGTQIKTVSKEALEFLNQYDWPGNVRELANILEQSYYHMGHDEVLMPHHLPKEIGILNKSELMSQEMDKPLQNILEEVEKENILKTLRYCNGNKRKTAYHLGIQRSTLYLKLRKFDLL